MVEEFYQSLNKNSSKKLNLLKNETVLVKQRKLKEFNKSTKNTSNNTLKNLKPVNIKDEILNSFKVNNSANVSDIVRASNQKYVESDKLIRKLRKNLRPKKRNPIRDEDVKKIKNEFNLKPKTYYEYKLTNEDKIQGKMNESINLTKADGKTKLKNGNNTKGALDMFAESLLFVNRLYNKEFGVDKRKVPAHVPHFIDKDIMADLQHR